MKNLIRLLFSIFIFGNITSVAQQPKIKWWYNVKDNAFAQAAAADIDKDGKLEIVFGCYRNDSCVYALNAENGSLLWKRNTGGCNDAAPIIYDVDNNDSLEVIVAGSCVPKTFCLNGFTGSNKWIANSSGSDSPPSIADIDKDGKPEILHGEFGGSVLCLNAENGSQSWKIMVDNTSWIQTAPSIADFDKDGWLDFVVGNWSNTNNTVFAYRAKNPDSLWTFTGPTDYMYHGSAIADLDNDGYPELVLGDYDGNIFAINAENGSQLWKYTNTMSTYNYIGAPAVIADINNDKKYEVIFTSGNRIISLTHTGLLNWVYVIPNYGTCFRGVVVADVNNNDTMDVIFGDSKGFVRALRGSNGSLIWDINLAAHYGKEYDIDHAPIIADFDGDDTLDLFVVGGHAEYPDIHNNHGRAYALSIGKGKGPDWLMFQRDFRRTSCIPLDPAVSVEEHITESLTDLKLFPNPCKGKTILQIKLEQKSKMQISLFDLHGRIVLETPEITKEMGEHEIEIILLAEKVPTGIYFLKILVGEKVGYRKLVVE